MFCRYCGKRIAEDSFFCSYCGKKVAEEAEETVVFNTPFVSDPEFVWNVQDFTRPPKDDADEEVFFWGEPKPEQPEPNAEVANVQLFAQAGTSAETWGFVQADRETDPAAWDMAQNEMSSVADPWDMAQNEVSSAAGPWDMAQNEAPPAASPWDSPQHEMSSATGPWDMAQHEVSSVAGPWDLSQSEAPPAAAPPALIGQKAEKKERRSDAEQAEKINKFYTFNQKNEEFQKLLDKEYEKIKKGRPLEAESAADNFDGAFDSETPTETTGGSAGGVRQEAPPEAGRSADDARQEAPPETGGSADGARRDAPPEEQGEEAEEEWDAEHIIFDNETLAKKFDTTEFKRDLLESALEKAGAKGIILEKEQLDGWQISGLDGWADAPGTSRIEAEKYISDFQPRFPAESHSDSAESGAGAVPADSARPRAENEALAGDDMRRQVESGPLADSARQQAESGPLADRARRQVESEALAESIAEEISRHERERSAPEHLLYDTAKQEAFRALEELWGTGGEKERSQDASPAGAAAQKAEKKRKRRRRDAENKKNEPPTDAENKKNEPSADAENKKNDSVADAENKEKTPSVGKKKKSGTRQVGRIVVLTIIALWVAWLLVLAIYTFAPNSLAAWFINERLSFTVSWLADDRQSERASHPTDNGANGGLEDPEQSQPNPAPRANKAELIVSQLAHNKNILRIEANDALAFDPTQNYPIPDIGASAPIENNIWLHEDGQSTYYDEALVGTLIQFDSQWIDYVNAGDQSVLNLTSPGGLAEQNILSFQGNEALTKIFKLLQIGEIRQGAHGFYVWAYEELSDEENGNTVDRQYNWIYHMEPVDGQMKIIGYYPF